MGRKVPTEAELIKKWEGLTFTDNFIFSRVMHDEKICRQVVELILGVKIGKIQYLSAQDEHKTDPHSIQALSQQFPLRLILSKSHFKIKVYFVFSVLFIVILRELSVLVFG